MHTEAYTACGRISNEGSMEERLKVLPPSGSHEEVKEKHSSKPKNGEFDPLATKAKFDRLWLNDREQFDPKRNAFERLRVERTWELLAQHIDLKNAIGVEEEVSMPLMYPQTLSKN